MRTGLYRWNTPKQRRMGSIGDEPIYADCADCGEKDAVIHGHLGNMDNNGDILLLIPEGEIIGGKEAVYCGPCLDKRWNAEG